MTIDAPVVRPERFDLGDGLIMRWSTAADKDDLGELMGEGFRLRTLGRTIPKGYEPLPNDFIRAATRRVMSGHSAVMDPTDFAVVEDTNAKAGELRLVAGMSLQRLPGYYGKTDLQFGVVELVASLPKYRNRGLVRRLFLDMVHPASDARGDVIQLIFGIPHFYLREFLIVNDHDFIPKLQEGKKEPFTLRKPTRADLPFLLKMSTREAQGSPAEVGFHYDITYWLYTAFETVENAESYHDGDRMNRIVVDRKTGEDVGLVVFSGGIGFQWELFTLNESPERGITYREAMFPILRQIMVEAKERWNAPLEKLRLELKDDMEADEKRRQESDDPKVKFAPVLHNLLEYDADRVGKTFYMLLHPSHPARQLLQVSKYTTQTWSGYRMYTRIKSYPRFLTKVAPTLEHRLANSPMAGFSATLLINFYRITEGASAKGLKLRFVKGKFIAAEDWAKPSDESDLETDRLAVLAAEKKKKRAKEALSEANGDDSNNTNADEEDKVEPVELTAAFPPLVFTRLILGEMSFDQIKVAHDDAYATGDDCKMLLKILFPVVDHNTDNFWW
ncbi:hypothetical protein BGZ73_000074 [Actinomortierella ambigua]|nr:hypothetical protein BGZ73_000074 [Actinomortierella ambigua]